MVLVRNGKLLRKATSVDNFLDLGDEKSSLEDMSPGDFTLEFCRPMRSLPFWFSLNLLGAQNFQKALEEKFDLAMFFYNELAKDRRIERGPEPDLVAVIFR